MPRRCIASRDWSIVGLSGESFMPSVMYCNALRFPSRAVLGDQLTANFPERDRPHFADVVDLIACCELPEVEMKGFRGYALFGFVTVVPMRVLQPVFMYRNVSGSCGSPFGPSDERSATGNRRMPYNNSIRSRERSDKSDNPTPRKFRADRPRVRIKVQSG